MELKDYLIENKGKTVEVTVSPLNELVEEYVTIITLDDKGIDEVLQISLFDEILGVKDVSSKNSGKNRAKRKTVTRRV